MAALVVAALGLIGCGAGTSAPAPVAGPSSFPVLTLPAVTTAPPPLQTVPLGPAPTLAPGSAVVVVAGTGFDVTGGLEGPVYRADECHSRKGVGGSPLPDPVCTPGAVSGQVTQSGLASTICGSGDYATSVQPPASVTGPFTDFELQVYGIASPDPGYRLDELVPLDLGGASDTRNLWVVTDEIALARARVDNGLHGLVCGAVSGGPTVPLALAQRLVAADWTTALAQATAAETGG